MADAIVAFLIKELALVIKKEVEQEVRLVVGVETEVGRLQKTFETLQTVLNEAEQRQMDDGAVKIWLDNLKNAAYEMEDVLDEWATKIQLEKKNPHEVSSYYEVSSSYEVPSSYEVSSSYSCSPFFSCFKKTALRHNIGSRIKAIGETLDIGSRIKAIRETQDIGSRIKTIREKLDSIKQEKDQFLFSTSERVREGPKTIRTDTSHIIVDLDDICGRDDDQKTILDKLLGNESTTIHQHDESSDPRIISIIGMGGLGKTTLAQLVFNHHRIQTHFEITMWVCVSHPFDRIMVAKAIIREATKKHTKPIEWNAIEWNSLHYDLCESVRGKKFLLVLDDVWTEDPDKLDPLKHLLVLGAEGSRMLVTTRNESVASSINSWKHILKKLSPNHSRTLLCRKAFHGHQNKEEDSALNKIILGILDKCGGLPLALRLLGTVMNRKVDSENWGRILSSKFWELQGFDNEKLLYPAFLVSYDRLSSNLKNCFAYCSTFQKGEKIKKHTLIKLWMAQGLLNSEEPELLGEDFFDELAAHSFFQDFSVDDNGNKVSFKMHDLIHDFAHFLTNPCYISYYNDDKSCLNQPNSSKPIHLRFIYNPDSTIDSFHESVKKVCNLRTLQSMRRRGHEFKFGFKSGNLSSDLIHHLKCLRVLKLKRMGISHLPDEIDKLIHLRYLDLSHNQALYMLPNSVGRLINLQTLKLKDCRSLEKLPAEMKGMIRLRNLDIRRSWQLEYLPKGIENWRSLQTLSTFIISDASEGCKIKELKYQNLLRDHLEINGLERLKATEEAAEADLHKKSQLSELLLIVLVLEQTPEEALAGSVLVLEQTPEEALAGSVLGVLRPHSNLKNLTINHFLGFPFPNWMGSTEALTHLRCLNLNGCINCSELPALGLLPSLEVLGLSQMPSLKRIGVEIYGGSHCATQVVFPKLISLYICSAPNLEVWEFGNGKVQVMPCVTSIYLEQCKALKTLPALGNLLSLQTLSIYEADKLVSVGHEFCGIVSSNSFSSLRAFPKLSSLTFCGLPNLEVMNLGEMPCVKILDIQQCPKLKSLRFRTKSLPSLEILNLVYGDNLEEFKVEEEKEEKNEEENSICQLPCLYKIHLEGCYKLESFPRHLPSLRSLYARACQALMSHQPYLPISPNLTSLRIDRNCDHSQLHLEYIAEFKELRQLEIFGSRMGDWSILSHIPDITINTRKIDPLTYSSSSY
ncbi:hypothetical protein MKW92_015790 [Papaver armeniacum]|nr:hypothetical protein MKW92_015790 [Papaver armeniacum]